MFLGQGQKAKYLDEELDCGLFDAGLSIKSNCRFLPPLNFANDLYYSLERNLRRLCLIG